MICHEQLRRQHRPPARRRTARPPRPDRHLRRALPARRHRHRPGRLRRQGERFEIKDKSGQIVGSSLIGQTYNLPKQNPDDPEEAAKPDLKWFQPRPSNGLGSNSVNQQYSLILSGATNKAGDNPDLVKLVTDAKDAVIADNSTATYQVKPSDVPADAVTSSGSGLDPNISPEYAKIQVHRVADRNGLDVKQVEKLVKDNTTGRTLGFMGEPRVNVLELNTALKALTKS